MNTYKRAIGVFYSQDETEEALRALKKSNFDMNRVNVIAKNANQVTDSTGLDVGYDEGNNAAEGAGAGATSGAVLGGIGGLLIGLGTLAIPGVGPIIVAGEAATTIATTLAGAGIGAAAGGIVGGLVGLGIPEEKAKIYSDRVSGGSYLVMVNGSDDDINHAEQILHNNGIEEYGVYNAADIDDGTYNRTSSINRVDTGEGVNTMGDTMGTRDQVYPTESSSSMSKQNLADRPMSNRVDALEDDRDLETRQKDNRNNTSNDADVIIIDNRDETR